MLLVVLLNSVRVRKGGPDNLGGIARMRERHDAFSGNSTMTKRSQRTYSAFKTKEEVVASPGRSREIVRWRNRNSSIAVIVFRRQSIVAPRTGFGCQYRLDAGTAGRKSLRRRLQGLYEKKPLTFRQNATMRCGRVASTA